MLRASLIWEGHGKSILVMILCLLGATASAQEQHPEPPQEPAPASTVGPAAPSGPEVIEQVLAAGAEGLARTEIQAAESKPLQIVVTALFHCSTLEEPPVPSDTPEEE